MHKEYLIIRENLPPLDISRAICKIQESEKFEIDELSHIVLNGTDNRIGYIGDETLELYNLSDKSLKKYHKELKDIFNSIISLDNLVLN